MSEAVNGPARGHVYVRTDVLYVGRRSVHLADNLEYEISAPDAGLLELVYRGDSSFVRLCSRVAELSPGASPASVAEHLGPALTDPRSVLELRGPVLAEAPQVIVCDFSEGSTVAPSRDLVTRLRRRQRVLHLGLKANLRGEWPWNASLDAAQKAHSHESWYDFAQWCRSVVAEHPDALLVLCGQQDAILFGDLVPRMRTLVALDPHWPAPTGASDMLGSDWVPEDPYEMVRDLYYALRFGPADELAGMHRGAGSSFARLEGYALRHATAVAYSMTDQPAALAQMGRSGSDDRLLHARRTKPLRRLREGTARALLLVAGMERGLQPLASFLHVLRPALDAGLVQQVLILSGESWYELELGDGVASVRDVGGLRPAAWACLGAVLFPGLLRDCRAAFEVLASGIPTGMVPSARPHPLHALVGPAGDLSGCTAAGFRTWLERLASGDDGLDRELFAAQRQALQRHELAAFAAELAVVPSGGEPHG